MNQPVNTETKEAADVAATVTREDLFALVWAEPMLRVAAKFSVSSSYMARVCTALNVPRPERGYWAKLAVGQHPPKPELPEALPGGQTLWNRSGDATPVRRPLPRPPTTKPRRRAEALSRQLEVHLLIQGAEAHFEVGRTSYDSQYLKPMKRLLVDLVVTRTGLDKALSFANGLFRELEAHDCRVALAPNGEYQRRATVDEHEVPEKRKTTDAYYDYHRLWSPGRNTLTYIGTVAIGLTVIELSEVAEARYVKGEYLTAPEPLWYTLADCIVSKLLTGRCPRVEKALTYRPGPPQEGLKPTKILGLDDFTIDPTSDDFFTRLVDLRDQAKAAGNPAEKALKIIANSTSYGIFIEVNRDDAPKAEPLSVFGPNGERLKIATKAIEDPGRYFHPLLGVLITGAARLMLGIAEKLTLDLGLDWAFCDTDSLAIARPKDMPRREFHGRTTEVINWFKPLNPYRKAGSILKIEDQNYEVGSKKMRSLYCWAISAKRYALFNRTGETVVLRKASAHGLGHLLDPYPESEAPADIPAPGVPLKEIGVRRWQYDVWYKIIEAALRDQPDSVPLDWHPAFKNPAASRYTASSPQLLNWVARWNEGKPYEEQIRPFAFLLSFTPRKGVFGPFTSTITETLTRGRPPKVDDPAPVAPYDTDPARALPNVFDRLTGKPVQPEELKTYAEMLAQYHLSPDLKFANGDHLDRGRTERRHVVATGFVWIGKEANQVGESGNEDPIWSAVEEFASA